MYSTPRVAFSFALRAAVVPLTLALLAQPGLADAPVKRRVALLQSAGTGPRELPSPDAASPVPQTVPDALLHPPVAAPAFTIVEAGWDRPIRVLPAARPGPRVLVYLHGYCGDVNAVGAFVPAAAEHGTLLALLGDVPCKGKPGRYQWSRDARALDQRIQRAIRLVNRSSQLDLDARDVTLFGYSQGAMRAEALARLHRKRYPRVILGGPPQRPRAQDFLHVQAVAVFGGELENTRDMSGGADDLIAAGLRARFFLLPGVDHGDFGGELAGNRALAEILAFVSNAPGPLPNAPAKLAR